MAYSVGDRVSGVVSGVTAYGAFVRLEDGSNGMIHISKLSRDFVSDIHSVIKKGDAVNATVIANNEGKIALSLIGETERAKRNEPQEYRPRVKTEPQDFESMLSMFKSASDERLSGINRKDRNKRRK